MKTGQNASSEAKMLAWGLKCSFRATSKLKYWLRDVISAPLNSGASQLLD